MARPTTEGRQAAGRALAARMNELRLTTARLSIQADIPDPKTINDFLAGKRWPRADTLGKLEEAVGWEYGTLRSIADGAVIPGEGDDDPVVAAVERSELSRANQHMLIGTYYRMLDDQQEEKPA